LSYEMYLLHPAVLFFIAPYMNEWPLTFGWLVFSGITIAVAQFVQQYFTEPVNVWLRFVLLKRRDAERKVLARVV